MTKTDVKTATKKVRITFTFPLETAKKIKSLMKGNYSQYVNNLISQKLANKRSDITFKELYERVKSNKGGIIVENKDELEKMYAEMGLR